MAKNGKLSKDYIKYLQSQRWKDLRALALHRAGGRCQSPGCGCDVALHVHHLKYTFMFQNEPVTDLMVLCKPCHYVVHNKKLRAERIVKRVVLYRNGDHKQVQGTRAEFCQMKTDNDKSIIKILTPGRFLKRLETIEAERAI
jgi:hypothetical protein